MCKTRTWKLGILIIAMASVCGTANAQHGHRHCYPHRVVTVVMRPDRTSHTSNRFTQKERLEMAVAYLNKFTNWNKEMMDRLYDRSQKRKTHQK